MDRKRVFSRYIYRQYGAATVELIIGCLAALPLFFAVSLLGKYADMRHKSVEAARYVAWEDVIWKNKKTLSDINYEATDRFMGHRQSTIVDKNKIKAKGVTEDPLWRDRALRTLMVSDGNTVRVTVSNKGIKNNVNHSPGVKSVAKKSGVSTQTVVGYQVDFPVTHRVRVKKTTAATGITQFFSSNHYKAPFKLNMKAGSAMLTDPWNAKSAPEYQQRVRKLTLEKILDLAVMPGTKTFGHLFPFTEGKYGADPNIIPKTEKILSIYKPN